MTVLRILILLIPLTKGKEESCLICGDERVVSNKDALFQLPSLGGFVDTVNCFQFQEQGYIGKIPPENCGDFLPYLEPCECQPW